MWFLVYHEFHMHDGRRKVTSKSATSSYLEMTLFSKSKLKLSIAAIPLVVRMLMPEWQNCCEMKIVLYLFLSTFPFMGCVIIYRHNSVFNYCKFLKPVKFLCITYFIILWPHMLQEIYWNFSSREEVIVFIESLFNYIWCQYINLRELLTNADSDLKIELKLQYRNCY